MGPTPFDLEAYIGRYPAGSESRLQRLLFIARKTQDHSELTKQAYVLAERHMRENLNVRCYKDVFGDNTNKGEIVYDAAWVQETELNSQTSMETLEARLSAAQAHLQKEAIRTAYLAIGEFARQRGDLQQALRAVMRSRDYCTNRSQTAHVCLLIIELAMDTKNYPQVHDYVAKAEHSTIPGDTTFPLKLRVASGAANLAQGKFKEAAGQLTSIPNQESISGDTVVSPEDIAQYGTLCGLASLGRNELQRLLDTQASGFLDLVPPLRDALQRYCRADYPGCLRILQELYPSLQLDMILAPHLDKLSETIMHKCCIEYLKPYRKVNLAQMATIFSIPVERLIEMLATLIGSGRIPNARIDCLSQTLERLSEDAILHRRQHDTKKRILAMEQSILNDAHAMMVRVACMENEGTRKSHFVDYMDSDDDDGDEPMELVAAGNPEDVY